MRNWVQCEVDPLRVGTFLDVDWESREDWPGDSSQKSYKWGGTMRNLTNGRVSRREGARRSSWSGRLRRRAVAMIAAGTALAFTLATAGGRLAAGIDEALETMRELLEA